MPIIAMAFYTLDGLGANTRYVTDEEYRSRNMDEYDKINSHTIPALYFKEFLLKQEPPVTLDALKIQSKSRHQKFTDKDLEAVWANTSVITVIDVRELLDIAKIKPEAFFMEYGEYLITVQF